MDEAKAPDLEIARDIVAAWLIAKGWVADEDAGCWRHPRHGERWSIWAAVSEEDSRS